MLVDAVLSMFSFFVFNIFHNIIQIGIVDMPLTHAAKAHATFEWIMYVYVDAHDENLETKTRTYVSLRSVVCNDIQSTTSPQQITLVECYYLKKNFKTACANLCANFWNIKKKIFNNVFSFTYLDSKGVCPTTYICKNSKSKKHNFAMYEWNVESLYFRCTLTETEKHFPKFLSGYIHQSSRV